MSRMHKRSAIIQKAKVFAATLAKDYVDILIGVPTACPLKQYTRAFSRIRSRAGINTITVSAGRVLSFKLILSHIVFMNFLPSAGQGTLIIRRQAQRRLVL